jgi:hypothetical protein
MNHGTAQSDSNSRCVIQLPTFLKSNSAGFYAEAAADPDACQYNAPLDKMTMCYYTVVENEYKLNIDTF